MFYYMSTYNVVPRVLHLWLSDFLDTSKALIQRFWDEELPQKECSRLFQSFSTKMQEINIFFTKGGCQYLLEAWTYLNLSYIFPYYMYIHISQQCSSLIRSNKNVRSCCYQHIFEAPNHHDGTCMITYIVNYLRSLGQL